MRLADLLAGLTRFADLGFGLPAGAAVRSCVLATRLARSLHLPEPDVQAAFYTALLHHVGCPGYAHETARLFGDELVANLAAGRTDAASRRDLLGSFLPALTQGRSSLERARITLTAVTKGAGWADGFTTTACEVGRDSARRLQLPEEVQVSLLHVFDVWHGRDRPAAWKGDDIPVAGRIARLTGIAVLFESVGGADLAMQAVRRRAGGMLDPALVDQFGREGLDWFTELGETGAEGSLLDMEPLPPVMAPDVRLVAEVFGDLADLKSPYLLGHSRTVAALAGSAAGHLGLPDQTRTDLEVAGLLHDVGRVAVSNVVWDKPGPLTADDWEKVRLHAYHSERILAGSTELARLSALVGRHHERLDGSGYHRGCTAQDLAMPARVLGAADRYRTLTEPRPHRAALTQDPAAEQLLADAQDGRLDVAAVDAVLAAAGHAMPTRSHREPSGLSSREVEVLGLVARGCSNAEIADRLVISRRTAEHHVQHIYVKLGVSSRAAATLFAIEHDLLDPG